MFYLSNSHPCHISSPGGEIETLNFCDTTMGFDLVERLILAPQDTFCKNWNFFHSSGVLSLSLIAVIHNSIEHYCQIKTSISVSFVTNLSAVGETVELILWPQRLWGGV